MAKEKVSATNPKVGRHVEVEYDFGDNLQDAVEKFGEDVVFSQFKQKCKVALQAVLRNWLAAGVSDEEIQNKVQAWKIGLGPQKKDPKQKLLEKFASMSDEEKKAFLAELKKMAS